MRRSREAFARLRDPSGVCAKSAAFASRACHAPCQARLFARLASLAARGSGRNDTPATPRVSFVESVWSICVCCVCFVSRVSRAERGEAGRSTRRGSVRSGRRHRARHTPPRVCARCRAPRRAGCGVDAPFPGRGVRTRPRDRGRFSRTPTRRESDTYWTRLASRTDRSGGSARQLRRSRRSRRWRRRDGPRADRGGHRAEPRRATGCGDAQRPREVLKKADAVSVRAAEERKRAFRILKREPATTPRHRERGGRGRPPAAAAAR